MPCYRWLTRDLPRTRESLPETVAQPPPHLTPSQSRPILALWMAYDMENVATNTLHTIRTRCEQLCRVHVSRRFDFSGLLADCTRDSLTTIAKQLTDSKKNDPRFMAVTAVHDVLEYLELDHNKLRCKTDELDHDSQTLIYSQHVPPHQWCSRCNFQAPDGIDETAAQAPCTTTGRSSGSGAAIMATGMCRRRHQGGCKKQIPLMAGAA